MSRANRGGPAPLSGDVLVVSEHAGARRAAERLLEGLGLRARTASTLAAARAALRLRLPAAVVLDLPLAGFVTGADLPLPPGTRLFAFGPHLPAGLEGCGVALTADALRAVLVPLLPLPPCPPPLSPGHRALMNDLIAKPGVLAVALLTAAGEVLGAEGESLPSAWTAALCGLLDTARTLEGGAPAGPLFSAQLEFERRTLLIVASGELLIVCALRDPSLSSLIRYLLRARLAA